MTASERHFVTHATEETIALGQRVELPELGLAAVWEKIPAGDKIQASFTIFSFSCVNICDTLSLTRRREGDTITLAGRSGRRSLKKLLIGARVPRRERDRIPVVRQNGAVLAVYGFGQAEGLRPAPGEPYYIVAIRKNTEEERE